MAVRLTAGDVFAEVDPAAGGRLSSLVVAGRERLISEANQSAFLPAITWGSFAMLPWVGRLRDGRLSWCGTTVQLPRSLGAHAIHGLTFDRAWDVLSADDRSVELGCRLGSAVGWPWDGDVRQSIVLGQASLELRIEVRAGEPMPVAVGWHPWFRRWGDEPISVAVPAEAVLETTADLIPTGAITPVTELTDLREATDLRDRRLDHTYVGVEGACVVAWTDLELSIEASPLRSVVVHSTPTAVCVEPQTAWPDAIRLDAEGVDTGLVGLSAGESFVVQSRWSWRGSSAGRDLS
jgi:aldose 1-epimerase